MEVFLLLLVALGRNTYLEEISMRGKNVDVPHFISDRHGRLHSLSDFQRIGKQHIGENFGLEV
jgi:hypothetical protein